MRAAAADGRLEAIAGPPAIQIGDADAGSVSHAFPRAAFDGMTFMLVYNASGAMTGNYPSMFGISGVERGGFRVQAAGAGVNQIGYRADFAGGQQNFGSRADGGRTAGRHVVSIRLADGLAEGIVDLDGVARRLVRAVSDAGSGIEPGQAVTSAPFSGELRREAAFAWSRCLTDAEVTLAHHWLARRHGFTLS